MHPKDIFAFKDECCLLHNGFCPIDSADLKNITYTYSIDESSSDYCKGLLCRMLKGEISLPQYFFDEDDKLSVKDGRHRLCIEDRLKQRGMSVREE